MILIANQKIKIKIKENRIKNVALNAFIFGMASYRSSCIDIQSKHLNVIFNVIIIEIYFFFIMVLQSKYQKHQICRFYQFHMSCVHEM